MGITSPLLQKLLTAFQLTVAEPATHDSIGAAILDADGIGGEFSQTLKSHGATTADRSTIIYGLESAASVLQAENNAIYKAEKIKELLPEVEKFISEWDESKGAPGKGVADHENPIHQLQEELGMRTHDGEWGNNTATALLEYETEGIRNGFAGGHDIDTRQFVEINNTTFGLDARMHREDVRQLVTQQNALKTQIEANSASHNAYIAEQFKECTDSVIDLTKENPFADIIQEIGPFSQIVDEIEITHERVVAAVTKACRKHLEQAQGVDAKVEAVEKVATELTGPINETVKSAINAANYAVIQRAVEAGANMERARNSGLGVTAP